MRSSHQAGRGNSTWTMLTDSGPGDRESVIGEALEVHGDRFVDELFGLLGWCRP
jgi:hypothetical protein